VTADPPPLPAQNVLFQPELPPPTIEVADAAEFLRSLEPGSVDLILTSPPYDKIRDYKGFSLDLEEVGRAAYQALKPGGVAILVMQDQTQRGRKTLTTFRTILAWEQAGFGLWECLVWYRHGRPGAWWAKRFRVDHEYVPVFVKGDKPAYFDKSHLAHPAKHAGKPMRGTQTLTNGKRVPMTPGIYAPLKSHGTVFEWQASAREKRAADYKRLKLKHPATYPDQLCRDLIPCFTQPGELVVDPFAGSSTTLIVAHDVGRRALGCDCSEEYVELSRERIADCLGWD
jgi:DNA modification methylase